MERVRETLRTIGLVLSASVDRWPVRSRPGRLQSSGLGSTAPIIIWGNWRHDLRRIERMLAAQGWGDAVIVDTRGLDLESAVDAGLVDGAAVTEALAALLPADVQPPIPADAAKPRSRRRRGANATQDAASPRTLLLPGRLRDLVDPEEIAARGSYVPHVIPSRIDALAETLRREGLAPAFGADTGVRLPAERIVMNAGFVSAVASIPLLAFAGWYGLLGLAAIWVAAVVLLLQYVLPAPIGARAPDASLARSLAAGAVAGVALAGAAALLGVADLATAAGLAMSGMALGGWLGCLGEERLDWHARATYRRVGFVLWIGVIAAAVQRI